MKTKEKILKTLLKIQELVESIADNQHRPKVHAYTYNAREELLKEMMQEDEKDGIYQGKPFIEDTSGSYNITQVQDAVNNWGMVHVPIEDVRDFLEECKTPQGLPESWCIDIRVDDPRVEGFKEWYGNMSLGCVFSFRFYGFNHVNGMYDRWYEYEQDKPRIITLDQFEQMSGINLMDYVHKSEQPKKTYTKEEILSAWNEYCEAGEFPLFIEWVKENM